MTEGEEARAHTHTHTHTTVLGQPEPWSKIAVAVHFFPVWATIRGENILTVDVAILNGKYTWKAAGMVHHKTAKSKTTRNRKQNFTTTVLASEQMSACRSQFLPFVQPRESTSTTPSACEDTKQGLGFSHSFLGFSMMISRPFLSRVFSSCLLARNSVAVNQKVRIMTSLIAKPCLWNGIRRWKGQKLGILLNSFCPPSLTLLVCLCVCVCVCVCVCTLDLFGSFVEISLVHKKIFEFDPLPLLPVSFGVYIGVATILFWLQATATGQCYNCRRGKKSRFVGERLSDCSNPRRNLLLSVYHIYEYDATKSRLVWHFIGTIYIYIYIAE